MRKIKKMDLRKLWIQIVATHISLYVAAQNVTLNPPTAETYEFKNISFTCTSNTEGYSKSEWTESFLNNKGFVRLLDGKCIAYGFLNNRDKYTVTCPTDKQFTVHIRNITRQQHNQAWRCTIGGQKSEIALIYVKVPVANVDMNAPNGNYMKENDQQIIRCNTSGGRPQPNVNWYLYHPDDHAEYNIAVNSTQTNTTIENGLVAIESVLRFFPNRSVNSWTLYCKAWTGTIYSTVQSREIYLNVSYPPDSPPIIHGYENGNVYKVIESEQGELVCSITGGNPLASLHWNCFDQASSQTTMNNTVKNKVTWVAERNQKMCSCESQHIIYGKQVSNVTVDVQYPPTEPLFTINSTVVSEVVKIIQNKTLRIACVGKSNPTPSYNWTGPNIANKIEQTLQVLNIQFLHQGKYRCTNANRMVRSNNTHEDGRNASSIGVKILYPPGQPKFKYGKSDGQLIEYNSIDVIKGDAFSIYCDSIGYPTPSFSWRSWNISGIISDADKPCTATNMMNETVGENRIGKTSSTLSITVLYPPDVPKINVSIGKDDVIATTQRINVIESETISLECYAHGKPTPSYKWTVNKTDEQKSNVLKLANISRKDEGNYTCHVHNLMNRTFGIAETGNAASNPADVGSLIGTSLKEGSILNITCPVIPGNLATTEVFWTRKRDSRQWNSSQLIIRNVSRADDAIYTCTVSNEMIPTIGNVTKTTRNGEFHLNIFYSSEIKDFVVFGKDSNEVIMVNQTEDVLFTCTTEANPASDITIRSPQYEHIAIVSSKNTLSRVLQNAACVNAGEYMCSSRNNYTHGHASTSTLILIVRCAPKPSSDSTYGGKIASTLHADVTLQFTAREYLDEPNKTTFIWFKDNTSVENDDSKFAMSSYGLQSNLSIRNITQSDFGRYELLVSNSVGQYTHLYQLMAKDKPEVPKGFGYMEDSITDSSVTLTWSPGFNGGYQQLFIVFYKIITGQQWQNETIIDTGDIEMKHNLSGLVGMTEYQVKMFARNEEGDSAYTDNLQFTTKAPASTPIESPSSLAVIVAATVSTVVIVTIFGIIVVVFIYKKRNNKETGRMYQNVSFTCNNTSILRESLPLDEIEFDGLQDVDDVPIITQERTEYSNSPEIIEKLDRIKVTELFSYVSDRGEESFEADYQKLPTELQKPCTFARKPENIALNRYNGIYPYDHSRVKIKGQPDFFINACYIDGYESSRKYIASLGPTAKTTSGYKTFWEMVWYERSDVIVMLTNLREPSGMKCDKYWPNQDKSEWYGDVCVSSESTECFAEYTVRTFTVSKEEERRSLTHLHYTAWPDKTVPEDVTSLIDFRQRMKATPASSEGPIVVHCSAGIGRTGTLIALDRLIEEGKDTGSVNVFECVNNMREQRVKMVQTFEQYMYIYKALVNALTFDSETIPVETFQEYIDSTNNNMYSMMFQQLRQSVETDSKADFEARCKNEKLTNKNRRGADIPGSRFRALLYLNRGDKTSEYINAVYINSFTKKDYFIGAQSPLPGTVADFITLVYQEDCSCIATMEDLKEPGMTVGLYLPDDNKTLTIGNFEVSSSRLETKDNFVVRKMKIKYTGKFDSGEKSIYHFQYTKWMVGHDNPVDARAFVQFVSEVDEYANEFGEERSRVIVHCLKANERSGLFCAMSILMEKIKFERQVNVLNALRHLRTRRPSAITSMEQLKFCYQAISSYINMKKHG